jgi:hypothetical protein
VKPVLLVPAEDGATTSVLVLDEEGERALRRLRLALDLGGDPRPPARAPPAELKARLEGDLLCVEYRPP